MSLKLVIFDCDGVLFDSRPANVAFHNAVLERLGLPRLDSEGEDLGHFMAASQLYDHLLGSNTPIRKRASEVARALDYSPFYDLMEPVAGLFETMETLKDGYQLGMASNRSRTVHVVAQRFGLSRYLDVVVGTGDVARPKPAPDMLLYCTERLGISTELAVFVGDADSDRLAAEAAGMSFIGVGSDSGADHPISSIAEVPKHLLATSRRRR